MVETSHSRANGRRSRSRWSRWWLALAIPVAVVSLYQTRAFTLPYAARWLNVGEVPTKTDYVLPLSGDPDTRPFVAATLYKTGLASQVLVSRVAQAPGPTLWPAPHETTRQVLLSCGVPDEKIHVLEVPHRNTFEEAVALKKFLLDHPNQTVSIVTNHFHTRRTRWAFHRVLGPPAERLQFVAAPCDGFDESNWWRDDEGFATYTTEYVKLAYYMIRHGNVLSWLALLFVSIIVATRKNRQSQPFSD